MKVVINVVNRFGHPRLWNASEINDILIQVDTLYNICGGHVDWPLTERMMMAHMAEHCEETRIEIIKGTNVAQEFHVFRDTSAELWETMKTHVSEDCRIASLAIKATRLTMSETNVTLISR